jgi:hypothetical protein
LSETSEEIPAAKITRENEMLGNEALSMFPLMRRWWILGIRGGREWPTTLVSTIVIMLSVQNRTAKNDRSARRPIIWFAPGVERN